LFCWNKGLPALHGIARAFDQLYAIFIYNHFQNKNTMVRVNSGPGTIVTGTRPRLKAILNQIAYFYNTLHCTRNRKR
jgi:hypothetical protein